MSEKDTENNDIQDVSLVQLAIDQQPGEFADAVGSQLMSRAKERLDANREEQSSSYFTNDDPTEQQ